MTSLHHPVLVVGGGNAGISLAARLLRQGVVAPGDLALVEPETVHRYRPLLNYVGVGEATMASLEKPAAEVVPEGCTWVQDQVVAVDAAASSVTTGSGRTLTFDTLVLCPGLTEDWEATPGLHEAYESGWAGSTYVVGSVEQVWPRLSGLRSGRVVFSVPPEPAPCGPTALKPLLMACDHWRRAGVLGDLDVHLVLPPGPITTLAEPDRRLEEAFAASGVHVTRGQVTGVDHAAATVDAVGADGAVTLDDVTYAHVVPHYRAPRWIGASGLADGSDAGLVEVDPRTFRHVRHPAVWALGDVAGVTSRPSGGGLRHQVKILAGNLRAAAEGGELDEYDGYTVAPVTLDRRELLLVEVDREGNATPSVPLVDLGKPRRLTWLVDRHLLPQTYWHRILRGKV